MVSLQSDFWNEIFDRKRGVIKPGSHRMQFLLGEKGLLKKDIDSRPFTISVAGTNGKGSCASTLESTFRHCGYSTFLYTSPHLVDVSERFLSNGKPIPMQMLLDAAQYMYEFSKSRLSNVTFFEILTLTAAHFVDVLKPDFFVCEVGLGGRLDSVNSFASDISIVTSIGLDHQEYLGTTLQEIGFEKSCIARRNKPCFFGPMKKESLEGLLKGINMKGALPIQVEAQPKLQGDFQLEDFKKNYKKHSLTHFFPLAASMCLAVVEYLKKQDILNLKPPEVSKGIQAAFIPGRFDLRAWNNRTILFDVCHNPHAALYFVKTFVEVYGTHKISTLIMGVLLDKNWKEMIHIFKDQVNEFWLVTFANERAVSLPELKNFALENKIHARFFENPEMVVSNILTDDSTPNGKLKNDTSHQQISEKSGAVPTLVCLGSVAFVGSIMKSMNFIPYQNP